MDDERDAKGSWLTRRSVLTAAGALAGGLVTTAGCKYRKQLFLIGSPPQAESERSEWAGSRVRAYRPLGRTGFEISDISFGCSDLNDPRVAQRALERGINYFDTSPDYGREKRAMLLYSRVPPERRADRCLACDAPCSGACECGIPIRARLERAHRSLRWS